MIPTLYRRDRPVVAAPVFDPAVVAADLIDPLTSPIPPSWRMTDDPEWSELVAELGDPTAVDAHVDVDPPEDDRPAAVAVEVEVELPPTVALDANLVEWCSACGADAGDPCRTPSGAVKIGVHPIRVAEHDDRTAGAA